MVMELTRQVCFATVQAAEAAGAVYQGVGVGVSQSSGWVMMERREVLGLDDPLVSRRPEAPCQSGPAWLRRDR